MTFELVVFAFTPTTTIEQGLAAATRMDDYLRRAPGFISRQLFHDDAANQWVDLVAWRTRDEALAAMSGFPECCTRLWSMPARPTRKRTHASGANAHAASLAALRNLGPASAAMLQAAGIASAAELRRIGAVAAFHRVMMHRAGRVSINLLYAMEGALTNCRWDQLPVATRERLRLAANTPFAATAAEPRSTRARSRPPLRHRGSGDPG
jgi:DNA transformation protein and related proteins